MGKLFLFSSLLVLLFLFPPALVAADTLPTPTPVQKSDYALPYPGLLPDNPLYILKTARDNIIGFLISDPVKKARFAILQSDKRLQAGIFLYQKDRTKLPLALTTISKGENYYEEAFSKISQAKRQGLVIGEVTGQLIQSGKKHVEVLHDVFDDVTGSDKAFITPHIERMEKLEKQAEIFALK